MSEFYWPALLEPASSRLEILDSAGRFQSPLNGYTRTVSRPGERMRLTMNFQNTNGAMRAALQAHIAEMRGAVHRVWAYDHANRLRGSFPATELLSNNTFANGTTGWTADNCVLTVVDRVARMTVTTPAANVQIRQSLALTQYAPYVLRGFILDGPQTSGLSIGPSLTLGAAQSSQGYSSSRGMKTVVGVAEDATSRNQFPAVFSSVTGFSAGAYLSVPYTSLARCALADNSPNAFQRSDELENAYWTAGGLLSRTANNATAPDGTATADTIVEDSAASQHNINKSETRTSAAEDWCVGCYVKRGAGTRNFGLVIGRDGTNYTRATFNLGTGAVNGVTNNGDNTNGRAFIVNAGNGWYLCYVVARLAASTGVFVQADILDGSFAASYTGDGTSSLQLWRLGAARSGVPFRVGQTTSAATTGTNQALAGVLHSKGWPASTNGLLLPGDQYQLGNQIHIVTSPVNSDAAGLAVIEGYPARRSAAADNAPIIINQPMGKFFLESDANGWSNAPGLFSDAEIVLAEAA